ncbi:protein with nucleoside triphosphate hydrolase domain [Yersinia pseudotuberculosis]|nr:protein with nucleoside triphosphate hydrolase domain [Yersinia pseudotuberculosis]
MKRLQNELTSLVNRGMDRHLRLAVTGLSRSGKTAFITSLVNQLLHVHSGARLPLFSAVRDERLLGVKRVPQRDLGIQRFTYDEGLASLYGTPPNWPTPTRGVSEIRLALRFRSSDSLLRHFKETSTLYLEIVDYPGEWLLDLPMLEQDYLSWSRQMEGLLQGDRAGWAKPWLALCQQCDPLAPANENQLAAIAQAYTDYLVRCKNEGLHFIQPGRFVLPGDMAGAPHYSSSLGWMSMALGSRVWLRPINTQIWACCAPVLTITVIRSLKAFIKSILFVLIGKSYW